ncbi:hypothetical protein, partial [Microlunatus soli]
GDSDQPGDSDQQGASTLEVGTPEINGESADSQPGPQVKPGDSFDLEVSATNTGDDPVSDVRGQAGDTELKCNDTTLDSGATTTCAGTIDAPVEAGGYSFGVGVGGTNASTDDPVQSTTSAYFTAGKASQGDSPQGNSSDSDSDQPSTSDDSDQPSNSGDTDQTGSSDGSDQPSDSDQGGSTIEVGAPVINGSTAGSQPGPQVKPGDSFDLEVSATNTGDDPVTDVRGQAGDTELKCNDTTLDSGATTTCAGTIEAPVEAGGYVFGLGVGGTNASTDEAVQSTTSAYFTAGEASEGTSGSNTGGTDNGSSTAGANGSGTESGIGGQYGTGGDNSTGTEGQYATGGTQSGYGQVGAVPQGSVHAGYGPSDRYPDPMWLLAGGLLALVSAGGLFAAQRRRTADNAGSSSDGGRR